MVGLSNTCNSLISSAAIAWPASSAPRIVMSAPGFVDVPHRVEIEGALDVGPGAGHRLERPREQSLLGGPPELGEVANHRG